MDMQKMFSLEGKTALVTGGAYGIGFAIAEALASAGANIAFNCRSQANLDKALVGYAAKGIDAHGYIADVTDEAQVTELIAKIETELGGVDILVNNAGINIPRLLVDEGNQYELDEATWDKVMGVNLKGVYLCAQAAGRVMVKQGAGVILNMSSESGLEGSEGQSVYAASKNAVNSLTRSWAKELGKYNIRVVAVAPGILEATGLRSPAYNEALAYTRGCKVEDLSTDYTKVIPLGRDGKLDEVADLVTYLVSDRASYITGTTIDISGGKSRG